MSDEPKQFFRGMPERRRAPQTFRLGDTVRVLSGPFAAFTGRIEGINHGRRLLKVRVSIFGRETPIKLGYADAEKVSFSDSSD
jgi:transcriptional antiterminator NusG